ncbi:Transthyretin-like family protein [Dictyocaulus viviparus]|uniref:Transthyretin-like family protein n=1 Tax=Dictyocaulus viviparus TaxID=29172 RepID=A0A0D8XQ26_DICVI|nr:Transthyretin-like family protein [Dictyocaulus viviparus]
MKGIIVCLCLVVCVISVFCKLQNVTVKGVTVCQKRRMANQRVQLYDRDTLDPNDLLAEIHTNKDGEFKLFGEENEVGSIEPFVRIHHNCNTKPGCTRISDYEVPRDKIGGLYDMTYVTLDIVKMRFVVLVVLAMCSISVLAKMQNVTVKGIAVCNKKRLANVKVELYDRDTLDPNDLLAEMHTNAEGEFELFGQEDEVGSIEPFIRLTHNCLAKPGCQRIGDYEVPHDKIGDVYDMTYVTLDIVVHGEKEKC